MPSIPDSITGMDPCARNLEMGHTIKAGYPWILLPRQSFEQKLTEGMLLRATVCPPGPFETPAT
jgi:hypothetical protein